MMIPKKAISGMYKYLVDLEINFSHVSQENAATNLQVIVVLSNIAFLLA